jgi:hypothetical protein
MRTLIFVLLTCVSGMPHTALGGVISTDLETVGDGLLTYDTINKREWLDLPETSGMRLAEVLAQMEPGGRLEGFQFATLEDVTELAASAGVGWMEPWLLPGNRDARAFDLIGLLGPVFHRTGGVLVDVRASFGLIADENSLGERMFNDTNFCVVNVGLPRPHSDLVPHIDYSAQGGVFTAGPVDWPSIANLPPMAIGDIGPFWLYRAVPEPCGITLLSTGVGLLLRARLRCATPRG